MKETEVVYSVQYSDAACAFNTYVLWAKGNNNSCCFYSKENTINRIASLIDWPLCYSTESTRNRIASLID